MSVHIIRGDALALPLANDSVDIVVTSPPYFGLRSYRDGGEHYVGQLGSESTPTEFVDALIAATREMVRVVKPSGSIFVNLGDKYASSGGHGAGTTSQRATRSQYVEQIGRGERNTTGVPTKSLVGVPWRYALRCIDDLGLILRAEIIWAKPNGLPESVTDRVRRSHETWFHFVLQPRYYSAVDEIREETHRVGLTWAEHVATGARTHAPDNGHISGNPGMAAHPLGKLPGSVWSIPTQPLTVPAHLGVDHFAAFPMEWPRRIIRGWSPAGTSAPTAPAVILDPFGGTGTTALVAHALGRHGISVDMSSDYCRLASWRCNDPGEIARARQVDKPAKQIDGQGDLFGFLGEKSAS